MNKKILKTDKTLTIKLHFVGLLIVILLYAFLDPIIALLTGGIVNFIVYLSIGFLEAKKDPIIFNPISYYFFWYSIIMGPSAIYTSTVLAAEGSIRFSTALVYPESVAIGFLIYSIGAFCLHAGLQLNRPKILKESVSNRGVLQSLHFIFLFL